MKGKGKKRRNVEEEEENNYMSSSTGLDHCASLRIFSLVNIKDDLI